MDQSKKRDYISFYLNTHHDFKEDYLVHLVEQVVTSSTVTSSTGVTIRIGIQE